MSRFTGVAGSFCGCMVLAATAVADTLNVPSQYGTIQSAINASSAGDEIVVAPGTYNEAVNMLGKAITLRSSGGAAVTTIDAYQLASSVIRCTQGESRDTVIDGFTLTNGRGTYEQSRRKGGGMFNKASSPTVMNCVFDDNKILAYEHNIDGGGAGMYNESGAAPRVVNCTFSNNELLGCSGWLNGGAGMYNDQSSPDVVGCTFTDNAGNNGGGMMNIRGAAPQIINCTFIGNHADFSGGGINITDDSSATICNTVLADNTAFHGAALYTNESHIDITNSTVVANRATRTGGAIFTLSADAATTINNSILWNNLADQEPWDKEIANWGGPGPDVSMSNVEGGETGPNFDMNPLFENASVHDYRLRDNSPLIDIAEDGYLPADAADIDDDGNMSEQIPLDHAMNRRVAGDAIDLGAFEFEVDGGCVADVSPPEGNGMVNIDDVLDVISAMGLPCNGCPQDVTPPGGNNAVNIDDLLTVIDAWGGCS